jgi:hypothetical protein
VGLPSQSYLFAQQPRGCFLVHVVVDRPTTNFTVLYSCMLPYCITKGGVSHTVWPCHLHEKKVC